MPEIDQVVCQEGRIGGSFGIEIGRSTKKERCSGRVSGPSWRPGKGRCVMFLGKTHYSHSASLHSGGYKWVPANLMLGVTL